MLSLHVGLMADSHAVDVPGKPIGPVAHVEIVKTDHVARHGLRLTILPAGLSPLGS